MAYQRPVLEELKREAVLLFKKHFISEPMFAACAPGRVNLIGEHTDYNEGLVLPVALPMVTVVIGSINGSSISEIISSAVNEAEQKIQIHMPLKETFACTLVPGKPKWANYVKGVIANFIGYEKLPGFNAVIVTSVPIGGGLSSSASLEVAVFTFLEALTGNTHILPIDKALKCQKAEHDYAGMPCGIMDQLVSVLGKAGQALLIDCRSLSSTLIPMTAKNLAILIINSNVKHELTGSEYADRRRQCFEAAEKLQLSSLRDAKLCDLDALEAMNVDQNVINRARHVITEIDRTASAAEALRNQDYKKMGMLMNESHESLRRDYEVSCAELDELVNLVRDIPGVFGTRMTGGGFGGCTVSLITQELVNNVIKKVEENYSGHPTFYICTPSDGARILKLSATDYITEDL